MKKCSFEKGSPANKPEDLETKSILSYGGEKINPVQKRKRPCRSRAGYGRIMNLVRTGHSDRRTSSFGSAAGSFFPVAGSFFPAARPAT